MKIFLIVTSFLILSVYGYAQDNGIGGYGYIEYNIMHNPKMQGNWLYGGGGLIVNQVFFGGLYYGSQTNAYNNLDLGRSELLLSLNKPDSLGSLFNLTLSDIGIQAGGVIWAEKPVQLTFSGRSGLFLSNLNETIPFSGALPSSSTRPFFTFTPEFKLSFMPWKILKTQLGAGYKYVHYADSRIKEDGLLGLRDHSFNSFYWSFSIMFGSFN